ncbi:hypothetical protein M7I_3130 [Glarea lozoyensis 74030]|uniref:Uncharacterized protein n=1 Tax=Glarea lozoyensis (strain ATCC 74030 / MF5533) TaxID=1104152 RepID=H0EKN1_GLAL7|nr:hypothetical protein M7I_3130 [Glarea lozoyensis 74030]
MSPISQITQFRGFRYNLSCWLLRFGFGRCATVVYTGDCGTGVYAILDGVYDTVDGVIEAE